MTTNRLISSAFSISKWLWLGCFAVCLAASPTARAVGLPTDPTSVIYTPNTLQQINANLPIAWSYHVQITSPASLPVGPTTVVLGVQVLAAPVGVSNSAAAALIGFDNPTLNFTGPNQTATVHVTFTEDAGGPTGDFRYFLSCSGWPASIRDNGTYINAHASPPDGLIAPSVSIDAPADGAQYTYTIGGPAVPVSVQSSATGTSAAPVLFLTTELTGDDEDGEPIPAAVLSAMVGIPLDGNGRLLLVLSFNGLGSPAAVGTQVILVNRPGTYTLAAVATNSVGSAVTSSQFIVQAVVPPPTVAINPPSNNPTYTYVRGLTSSTVPYTFTGTSALGGIRTLTATLDGNPITTATIVGAGGPGVGQLVATGNGTFTFDASSVNALGQHRIDVTATDDNGTASASATFVVAELVPAISTTIGHPLDGAVYSLPADASKLDIPYDFTSSATFGAPVTAIAATLTKDSDPVSSITIGSTVGLNTPVATGSGTFLDVQPGAYTVVATGTNSALGLVATDTNLFTVVMPPPPIISFTQAPSATYTTLTGYTLSIPVAIQTTHVNPATGANIVSQSLMLDDQPVTALASSDLNTLTATGTATLSIPAPSAGTTTHTLIANGVDAYGRPTTTSTTFSVTVTDPAITIVINAPANNSEYTLPTNGALTIPFTFTGDITTGATVDTITGNLGGTTNVTISSSTGLGTANHATGSGSLTITAPGTYTLTATDTNTKSGLSATTSVTFKVNQTQALPPLTVSITQAPLASYNLPCGCTPLSIPVTFVGRSTSPGSVSTLTATLDGKPVALSTLTGINTLTATGTATLSVNSVGNHVLVVKDTDPYGQTATASAAFTVVAQTPVISVVINAPSNNAVYVLPAGSSGYGSCSSGSTGSVSIPFTFTSNISAGATIDALSASLNGCSVSVTKSGLGTSTATGSGTLKVTNTGSYTFSVKATDNSCPVSATATVNFTVRKANPPAVTILAPTQTTYTSYSSGGCGSAGLSIPFSFRAVSEAGGISSLSASLDGQCVNVTSTGLGSLTATGSGTLSVGSAGSHKLTVTAKDPNGTALSSFTFTIVVQNPTPSVSIAKPTDGAVFTYDEGACPPSIPFSIAAKTNSGATISSLKATLNGCNVTVSNSGIGSNAVTGTGTLSIGGPGTYTLSATTTSGGVNASATVKFTVKKNAAPTCSTSWTGSICDGSSKTGGSTVPVSCQIKQTYSNGSCSTVRDTSVKFSVCEIYSNGAYGPAKTYSSSSYSIDGNNQYCLKLTTSTGRHRYRVDVYCFPNGGTTPKLIGSKEFSTN